jgi:hypothetical protein
MQEFRPYLHQKATKTGNLVARIAAKNLFNGDDGGNVRGKAPAALLRRFFPSKARILAPFLP